MSTAYLLAWLEADSSDAARFSITKVGIYSDSAMTITCDSRNVLPVEIMRADAPTFGEAVERVRKTCAVFVGFKDNSLRGRVCAMALAEGGGA